MILDFYCYTNICIDTCNVLNAWFIIIMHGTQPLLLEVNIKSANRTHQFTKVF